MKKSIFMYLTMFSFVIFLSGSAFAAYQDTNFTVLLGFDVLGNVELDYGTITVDEDVKVGFTPGIEGRYHVQEQISVGLGFRYQIPREQDVDNGIEFGFAPIYGILQFNIPQQGFTFGLLAHLGYNFFYADLDDLEKATPGQPSMDTEGGFYWGIGANVTLTNNIRIEALYNVNYGAITVDGSSEDGDVTYTKLTLAIGYCF